MREPWGPRTATRQARGSSFRRHHLPVAEGQSMTAGRPAQCKVAAILKRPHKPRSPVSTRQLPAAVPTSLGRLRLYPPRPPSRSQLGYAGCGDPHRQRRGIHQRPWPQLPPCLESPPACRHAREARSYPFRSGVTRCASPVWHLRTVSAATGGQRGSNGAVPGERNWAICTVHSRLGLADGRPGHSIRWPLDDVGELADDRELLDAV
jgi:hypothetical protein